MLNHKDKLKEYGQNHIVNILEKLDETKKQIKAFKVIII